MYLKTQLSFHIKITKNTVKADLLTYHPGLVITKKKKKVKAIKCITFLKFNPLLICLTGSKRSIINAALLLPMETRKKIFEETFSRLSTLAIQRHKVRINGTGTYYESQETWLTPEIYQKPQFQKGFTHSR